MLTLIHVTATVSGVVLAPLTLMVIDNPRLCNRMIGAMVALIAVAIASQP